MKKIYFIPLIVALTLVACSAKTQANPKTYIPAHPTPPNVPVVTDPSQPIEVKAGAQFTITVESQPTSNLHWEVAEQLDVKVVDYVWKDFVPKTPGDNSHGWDVWTFKAIAPGTTTITLAQYQGDTFTTDKKNTYTIVVK